MLVWGSRLVSLLVWWWWCHCLGHALAQRAHAIHLFSTVSFTEKSGELGGFDSTCISPTSPLPLPLCSHPALPVCHTMPYHTLFSLSSLQPLLIQFHSPIMLLSCSWVSLCLPVCLLCSLLYPHCSLCLQMTFEDSSLSDKQTELEKMSLLVSFHVSFVSACVHKVKSEG